MDALIRVDGALVRRIEGSGARQGALLAAAMAAQSPTSSATVEWLDGGALVSLGHGRYVNRGLGVGLGAMPAGELLDAVERFYPARQMPAMLEVCPWVPTALVAEMAQRGYRVQWFRNVFARSLADLPAPASPAPFTFAVVDASSFDSWTAILGELTAPGSPERAVNDEFCAAGHACLGEEDLLALDGGVPLACGSWNVVDGVGWIGAAATLTTARGHGAQHALVVERLRRISAAGADLAAATALVDGQSARNLVGLGFSVLYTQAVMTRPL